MVTPHPRHSNRKSFNMNGKLKKSNGSLILFGTLKLSHYPFHFSKQTSDSCFEIAISCLISFSLISTTPLNLNSCWVWLTDLCDMIFQKSSVWDVKKLLACHYECSNQNDTWANSIASHCRLSNHMGEILFAHVL